MCCNNIALLFSMGDIQRSVVHASGHLIRLREMWTIMVLKRFAQCKQGTYITYITFVSLIRKHMIHFTRCFITILYSWQYSLVTQILCKKLEQSRCHWPYQMCVSMVDTVQHYLRYVTSICLPNPFVMVLSVLGAFQKRVRNRKWKST